MTSITQLSQQKIDILRSGQAFDGIAAEIFQLLDVQPSGITQEGVWLHLKKIGQKASVDQIRVTLDKLTQRGELVDAKNGKNETVWKRARKPGVSITVVNNVSMLKDALEKVGNEARHAVEQAGRKAIIGMRSIDDVALSAATRERVNDMALAAAATESTAVTASAAAVAPTAPAPDAGAFSEQEAGAAPTPAEALSTPITTPNEIAPMPPSTDATTNPDATTATRGAVQVSAVGERIELGVLEALRGGKRSRKELMQICACSGTGIDNALARLVKRKVIARDPGKFGPYALLLAHGGAIPAADGTPSPRKTPASKPKASAKPAASAPEAQADLDPSLAQLVARLQPVERLPQKIQALDQLIMVMPPPIAEHLRAIRADFVRIAGA